MALSFYLIVLIFLTSGLYTEAGEKCVLRRPGDCCESCPSGWILFESRCFLFTFAEKDWDDAEVACIDLGGNLASIKAPSDYTFFRKLIITATGKDKSTWIGGHDGLKEGKWKWSDGSDFTFSAWAKGEPNNADGKENCMTLNYRGEDYVNDMQCTEKQSFICARSTTYSN